MKTQMILKTISISSLVHVLNLLETYLPQAHTDLERAGLIQYFEICYELTWKTMKKVLLHKGLEVLSPRETFRTAAAEQLISNIEIWFDFICPFCYLGMTKFEMALNNFEHKDDVRITYRSFQLNMSSDSTKGKNINQGLLSWKESFGSRTIVQNFYEIETKNYSLIENVLI